MGRGLSDLQQTSLAMARNNRLAENLGPIVFELRTEEEKVEWWSTPWEEWARRLRDTGFTDLSPAAFKSHQQYNPDKPFFGSVGVASGAGTQMSVKSPISTYCQAEAEERVRRAKEAGLAAWWQVETIEVADLYVWEVLDRFYDFGRHPKTLMGGIQPLASGRSMVRSGEKRFDRNAIGVKRYDAARIATAKGFKRLEDRGLALIYKFGNSPAIKLTTEGMREAERLSATSGYNVKTGSQYDPGPFLDDSEARWAKLEENTRALRDYALALKR